MPDGVDVLIAGAGPSGWALAAACARLGLRTALADPAPLAPWRATYGLWSDELSLPSGAIGAAPAQTLAIGTSEHRLRRRYLVVRNDGLRDWLIDDRVQLLTARVQHAVHGPHGSTVVFDKGHRVAAGIVVDATGLRRMLSGGPLRRAPTEQTAFGLVLGTADAERLVPHAGDTALFMDWRQVSQVDDPSFLYSIPLGGGRVLVEETSLARRPGLGHDLLAARLRARLAAVGLSPEGRQERVRIPLDLPPVRGGRVVPFGVAAGLVHPATGYSVATSLRLAPLVAEALADNLGHGPPEAAKAANRRIWTSRARAVHSLRGRGLRALVSMPPAALPQFFELFFALPEDRQRVFTSGREDLPGTAAMMVELFRHAPWDLRGRLIR
ncbi:MAG: lycopene beta-cyclase [Actinomycetota bacterium]|nr:lycopene beta-cyclase [Actinomycetota bacterium]